MTEDEQGLIEYLKRKFTPDYTTVHDHEAKLIYDTWHGACKFCREKDKPDALLPVGWTGHYTRKGGVKWFWCIVVGHDEGKVVVRTKSGYYHAHDPSEFEFAKSPPEGSSS